MEEDANKLFALLLELSGRDALPDRYETHLGFDVSASPGVRYTFVITLTHEPVSEFDAVEEDRMVVTLSRESYLMNSESLQTRFDELQGRIRTWVDEKWRTAPLLGGSGPEELDG